MTTAVPLTTAATREPGAAGVPSITSATACRIGQLRDGAGVPPASRPFVKWAGGKRRLVPFVADRLPLPTPRLVEPFAGGAALSLALAEEVQTVWLNDVNADLMNLYSLLQKEPEAFIDAARKLFVPEMNSPEAYYRLRERFNQTDCPLEKGTLFLYLNRHGYNGLCRYNRAGRFRSEEHTSELQSRGQLVCRLLLEK